VVTEEQVPQAPVSLPGITYAFVVFILEASVAFDTYQFLLEILSSLFSDHFFSSTAFNGFSCEKHPKEFHPWPFFFTCFLYPLLLVK
jgi:hypothetical protein